MKIKNTGAFNHPQSPIEKVQQQFENWRKTRTKRGPIPESLWEAAIELHPEYGINKISKALRLNYSNLKKRILNAGKNESNNPQSKIEKVQKQFENWRKTRTKRGPIPAPLWKAAIELHPAHSINKISRTLRLNSDNLRNKILNAGEKEALPPPSFIQLDMPGPKSYQNEWSIEMENLSGTKMKINIKSAEMPDLPLIFQNFLGKYR